MPGHGSTGWSTRSSYRSSDGFYSPGISLGESLSSALVKFHGWSNSTPSLPRLRTRREGVFGLT